MIGTLVVTFARQRLTSPMRLLLAAMLLCFGLAPVALSGELGALASFMLAPYAYIFAGGLIGQDVSAGVLTLVFARPVRRWEYVLARWLGAALLAAAFALVEVALAAAIAALRHGGLDARVVLLKCVDGMSAGFGGAALVTLFSALVPGLGDLGLVLAANVSVGVLDQVARARDWSAVVWVCARLHEFLAGALATEALVAPAPTPWVALATWLLAVAVSLLVATWAMNRKELSYVSG